MKMTVNIHDPEELLRRAHEAENETPHPNYEIVGRFAYGAPFWATVDGVRTRFVKSEHANIGKGWWCNDIDGKSPRGLHAVYTDADMTDIEPAGATS